MKKLFITSLFTCVALLSFAQNTNISGVINAYTNVTTISGTTVSVGSSAGYSAGDQVLIIQMQGATINESNSSSFGNITGIGNAGNYEFATICSVPNGTQLIVNNVQRTYSVSGNVQVVSVPVYDDATITGTLTADPWNGSVGGILVFECNGTLTMNAAIEISGLGFRGGAITTSTYSCSAFSNVTDYFYNITDGRGANKAEGVALFIPSKTGGRGAQANGGGGSNDHNGGGGGGANGSAGGLGGERIPATPFTCKCTAPGAAGKANTYSTSANKVFLGGGGGSGHENNVGEGSSGVNGGGIVIIKSNALNGNGQWINANGAPGPNPSFDGAGGGGAGGTVLLDVASYAGTLNINANGTDGGGVYGSGSSNCNGPGGGGSGGVLWVNQGSVPTNVNYVASGGLSGTTLGSMQSNCPVGGTNNATAGSAGITVTSLSIVENSCNVNSSVTASICGSDSLFVGGSWQTTSGVYVDSITSGCCDSIIQTTLTVVPNYSSTMNETICSGESITVNGTVYDQTVTGATEVFTNVGSSGCDSVVTINLTVLPPLTGTINETICDGESIVINGTTYDSAVTGATEVFTNVGPYNCDSIVTVNITVNSVDNTVTNASPTLTANLAGAAYQWINCPELTDISGETNQSYTATTNGSYAVIVTANGCSDTSACEEINGLGFIENEFGAGCVIFPNPTNGKFAIDLGETYQSVKISISDLSGKLILSEEHIEGQLFEMKLEETAGIYLLTIETEEKRAIVRLVKE
ncbi:MAG: T9SS type A sorting domain-containing protein [Crocinitomicaceae bacterium]